MSLLTRLLFALLLVVVTQTTLLAEEEAPKTNAPADTPAAPKTLVLFDGKSLANWKSVEFGGQAEVEVKDGLLVIGQGEPMTGIVYEGKTKLPTDHYEITLEAMKQAGDDFFVGLTFPVRDAHASFIVGGWAGGVVGISSIDGHDASENETTKYQTFPKDKWHKVRVRVDGDKLQAWIDDKQFVDFETKDRKLDTRIEMDLCKPLGLATYRTQTAVRKFEIKLLAQ